MKPKKPEVPGDLSVPGLIYRLRRDRWVMYWSPRSDLAKRGYQGKTVRLWPSDRVPPQQTEPTRAEWEEISRWCERYHAEQLTWARGGAPDDPRSIFDGTIDGLINVYQTHKKSPFRRVRYKTQLRYANYLMLLSENVGKVRVTHITFDHITTWQDEFAANPKGRPFKARAANLMGSLKRILAFGKLVLPRTSGCHDAHAIFTDMKDAGELLNNSTGERAEYMTDAQCRLLRHKAHELGHHSIALAQAIMYELGQRQKDAIGEWIPVAWPGVSDVVAGRKKWVMGIRWEQIDANLILTHRLSKSIHGAETIMDPKAGTWKAWDLTDYPMIVDELVRLCDGIVDRAKLPASGPMIVCEATRRPWVTDNFGKKWRKVADAAGVPANIQNRDSRAGAATEAKLAGAPREDIQRQLGHAKGETTEIYLRDDLEENRKLARLRTEKRKP